MVRFWYRRKSGPLFVMKRLTWLFQFALLSCESGRQTMYFHSFSFDMHNDSPDMEVLDFQYW